MKANDYVFVAGMRDVYLAKKTKGGCMSSDRRVVTDNEIIGMFEFFLRKWVEENGKKTVTLTSSKGEPVFEATLLSEEFENNGHKDKEGGNHDQD